MTTTPTAASDYNLLQVLRASSSPNCQLLTEVLDALHWDGELLQLRNALAGSPEKMDETDLLNTLYNLGYRWKVNRLGRRGFEELEQGAFPVLLQWSDRQLQGLQLIRDQHKLQAFEPPQTRVLAYRFALLDKSSKQISNQQWFQAQLLRFRSRIAQLYLISLFINVLALVPPFYIRSVYNQEIPSGELISIFTLLPFVLAAVGLQIWLSFRRQTKLSGLAAQLDMVISTRVMERMLQLRLPQLERFTPLSLARRLRSYYGLRQFITGPVALAALDLPYVVLYLGALAAISVTLSVLTLVVVVLCMGSVLAIAWFGNAVQQPLRQTKSDYEPLVMEMLQKLPAIKNAGDERLWSSRIEGASALAIRQSLGNLRLQDLTSILTSEFSQLTGALVLAAGAGLALRGEGLELGTLLAAMFFVWRTFRPIQMLFQALNRWQVVGPSLAQLNRFMSSSDGEPDSALTQTWLLPDPQGAIECRNVSLRLNELLDPALSGFNLKVDKGALVVITGPDGSGRSVLLKLLQGQYKPNSGHVLFDGADSLQYPLAQIRSSIRYLSADPEILPGTLRENLLLGQPLASDETLKRVCSELGLNALLEGAGLDRQFAGGSSSQELPVDLTYGVGLARLILSEPAVMLLDSPFSVLQREQSERLVDLLQRRRGRATTLVVTDDPQLASLADQVVVMRDGAVVFSGSPSELVNRQASPP
jgi:ATP-binding cassette subfamily C protein/ATP-binding cassette subfamily C protein LapB